MERATKRKASFSLFFWGGCLLKRETPTHATGGLNGWDSRWEGSPKRFPFERKKAQKGTHGLEKHGFGLM